MDRGMFIRAAVQGCGLLLAILLVAGTSHAQVRSVAARTLVGRELSLTAPALSSTEVRGDVLAVDSTIIRLRTGPAEITSVELSQIQNARLRVSESSRLRRGGFGAVVGAAAGALIYGVWAALRDGNHEYDTLGTLVVGAPLGAAAGLLVGALTPPRTWVEVNIVP